MNRFAIPTEVGLNSVLVEVLVLSALSQQVLYRSIENSCWVADAVY